MKKNFLYCHFKQDNYNEDDEYFYFEGYASTFDNVDLGKDIVIPGAFNKTLKERKPKLIYQHNMDMPVGIFEEVYEDTKGLFVKAKMPKQNTQCKDIFSLIKCGALDSMSIGYVPVIEEFDQEKNIRKLKEVKLYEISIVTLPMNPEAVMTGFKSVTPFQDVDFADRDEKWESASAIQRIREFTNSNDAPSATYKKAFMWFDNENKENFTAYKLPFMDVIDGALKIIPRAIFAIAGVLQGARGGVDIPEEDIAKIKTNVEKYYEKMDLESPWVSDEGKNFFVENIESLKELEKYLRSEGIAKKVSKTIISKAKKLSEMTIGVMPEVKRDADKAIDDNVLDIINKINKNLKGE